MKKIFLTLVFVCSIGVAENWIIDTDTILSNSQTPGIKSYPRKAKCLSANPGKTCVDFTGHNLRFERNVAGAWVIDGPSKTAYDGSVTSILTKRAGKTARRNRLSNAPAEAAAANSVPALRSIVADLAAELNELIGK